MRFSQATISAILAAAAVEARTFAVLRFNGKNGLTTGRMDPIVNPGGPSGHSHIVQGGNAFALDMTNDDPLKSTCTTAKIKNDKSNYWTPTMYFQDPKTGQLESVEMFYMNVYYFFENDNEKVHPFPKGLRMFVGNPSARTPPKTAAGVLDSAQGEPMSVQWTCPTRSQGKVYPAGSDGMHGVGIQDPNVDGQGVGFPDKECDGYASPLRADIHFPSCYDPSKDVRSYKDNMAFPNANRCPPGFIRVPHLFYEVYWDTLKFQGRWTPQQGSSPWVLSNGDKTGYSLHGDFINGWDENTLETIINTCNAGSSGMDLCPNIPGGLNTVEDCTVPNLVPETVSGVMSKLPGNNPILKWGESAAAAPVAPAASGNAPVASAPTTSKAAATPYDPYAPAPAATTSSKAATVPTTTKAAGAVVPTTSKAAANTPSSTRAAAVQNPSTTLKVVATPKPSAGKPGSNGGVVTSVVSEYETVYTTVTLPGPAPTKAAISGFAYKGCFSDVVSARVLTGIVYANIGNKQVTNTKCIAYCSTRGFSMAGTEFGGQCFCGNALVGSKSIAEDKCKMPCEGNASETCGGPDALSVYELKKTKRSSRHMHHHAVHAESF